jgi:hypothetical protein
VICPYCGEILLRCAPRGAVAVCDRDEATLAVKCRRRKSSKYAHMRCGKITYLRVMALS